MALYALYWFIVYRRIRKTAFKFLLSNLLTNLIMYNALYLSPSTAYLCRDTGTRSMSAARKLSHRLNFQSNKSTGITSKQTMTKIRRVVQWMVLLAQNKKVKCPSSGAVFDYRVGLVTCSIPSGQNDVDPAFFRKVLLSSLLDALEYHWGMSMYIWKLEKQGNGALHVHITVDCYVPAEWLRDFWCKILSKHGLLYQYNLKFASMSRADYVNYRLTTDHANFRNRFTSYKAMLSALSNAYDQGVADRWLKPNCTDVHSVKSVQDMAAYMAKYLSKNSGAESGTCLRVWACSRNLSKLGSVKVGYNEGAAGYVAKCVSVVARSFEDLWYTDRLTKEPVNFGAVARLIVKRAELLQSRLVGEVLYCVRDLFHRKCLPDKLEFSISDSFNLVMSNFKSESYAC